uniref:rho guanine nucleotide exchange factor 38-like n=1 Tax=Myxine glutinosa TaxID=7769 RepID=UPI00358F8310
MSDASIETKMVGKYKEGKISLQNIHNEWKKRRACRKWRRVHFGVIGSFGGSRPNEVMGHLDEGPSLNLEQEVEDKLSHYDFGCNIGTLCPKISHPVISKTRSMDTDCNVRRAERRELVLQAHEPARLFMLRGDTRVGNGVDLQLFCGDIVGFMKTHDGLGDSTRWLVDCGGVRGLVLASLLTPYPKKRHYSTHDGASREGTSPRTPRRGFVKTPSDYNNTSSQTSLNPMNPTPRGSPPISKGFGGSCNQESVIPIETRSMQACVASQGTTHFVAAYPFQADGSGQLSLVAGQQVRLKRSHDLSGNPEWWFVESNGSDGFVPSAYLVATNSPKQQHRPYPHQKQ